MEEKYPITLLGSDVAMVLLIFIGVLIVTIVLSVVIGKILAFIIR